MSGRVLRPLDVHVVKCKCGLRARCEGMNDYLAAAYVNHMGSRRCAGCGSMLSINELCGARNNAVPCDARCTGAKGHQCECSCGGENHGATA